MRLLLLGLGGVGRAAHTPGGPPGAPTPLGHPPGPAPTPPGRAVVAGGKEGLAWQSNCCWGRRKGVFGMIAVMKAKGALIAGLPVCTWQTQSMVFAGVHRSLRARDRYLAKHSDKAG
eukprot:350413-Chlamydomonas_euryale.AAC.7